MTTTVSRFSSKVFPLLTLFSFSFQTIVFVLFFIILLFLFFLLLHALLLYLRTFLRILIHVLLLLVTIGVLKWWLASWPLLYLATSNVWRCNGFQLLSSILGVPLWFCSRGSSHSLLDCKQTVRSSAGRHRRLVVWKPPQEKAQENSNQDRTQRLRKSRKQVYTTLIQVIT